MTIYYTGDIHGDPFSRFSYNKNPALRNLNGNDVMFILGDFGVFWDEEATAEEKYKMEWLSEKPWTTIAITGNHENYDRILALQETEKYGGKVRVTDYDNIFVVPDITIFDIQGQHILCLPRADSHDIYPLNDMRQDFYHLNTGYSNLINPFFYENDEWKITAKIMIEDGLFFRVVGKSWWPQEKIPVNEYMDFMQQHENEHFDMILSHEVPSGIYEWYGHSISNEGQRYFDMLARTLGYDNWLHGHFHFDGKWPNIGEGHTQYGDKMCGLYKKIISSVDDIEKEFLFNKINKTVDNN